MLQSWSGIPVTPSIPHYWPWWLMLLGSLVQQHVDGFNFLCLFSRKGKLRFLYTTSCHMLATRSLVRSVQSPVSWSVTGLHRSSSKKCLPWTHSSFRMSLFLVTAAPIIFFKWLVFRLSKIFCLDMFLVQKKCQTFFCRLRTVLKCLKQHFHSQKSRSIHKMDFLQNILGNGKSTSGVAI